MSERLFGAVNINEIAGFSVASEKHPERNEDSYFADDENIAIGVFDGMGGHAGSERASREAARVVAEHLRQASVVLPRELGRRAVYDALMMGHHAIIDGTGSDIGTTAAVVKLFDDGSDLYAAVGHVGDSRAYLMRDGDLLQLTLDNLRRSYKNYDDKERLRDAAAWRMQESLSRVTDISQLNAEERREFKWRNVISSCLGSRDALPYIATSDLTLNGNDKLLVTSDGVHDNLTTAEIARIMRDSDTVEAITKKLVCSALTRSRDRRHLRAKPDDITAVAVIV